MGVPGGVGILLTLPRPDWLRVHPASYPVCAGVKKLERKADRSVLTSTYRGSYISPDPYSKIRSSRNQRSHAATGISKASCSQSIVLEQYPVALVCNDRRVCFVGSMVVVFAEFIDSLVNSRVICA
jgi:hypothetical protein